MPENSLPGPTSTPYAPPMICTPSLQPPLPKWLLVIFTPTGELFS
jgi:hypothetical protein